MTSDDLALVKGIIIDAVEASVKGTVPDEIKKTVNGKIDGLRKLVEEHNEKHEKDMEDIKPVLQDYKERQAATAYAKKIGDGVKWTAGLVSAAGIILAALKVLFSK